ncbi:ATP-binding protein [Sphingomonas sp. YL-JM2C]
MGRIFRLLDSIHARVTAIVVLHVTAVAALLLFIANQPDNGSRHVYYVIMPEELATTVRAIEAVQEPARHAVMAALAQSGTHIDILPDFPRDAKPSAAPISGRMAQYQSALNGREWRIEAADGTVWRSRHAGRTVTTGKLRFIVRIAAGQVVAIYKDGAPAVTQILSRIGLVTMGILAFALLAILILSRQVTGPVRRMSAMLRPEAGSLAMADMPVTGARELKNLALEFNRMRRTLRDQAEDRTRILAAIAHDLRTYLTRLNFRADHIIDPRQHALAAADLAEMTAVLNDTLTFAKAVTDTADLQGAPTDLMEVLRSEVERRTGAGQPVSLTSTDCAGLETRVNAVTIHRILGNLIDNAVRYGGNAEISASRQAGHVVIRVEDDGPGVPETRLSDLMKPFFRLEASRGRNLGGSGLGLAIVDELAKRNNGSLRLANRCNGGFVATVRLPGL